MLVHHGRKQEQKGFRERDFARLLDAAHQQLGGNVVLVWDNYTHHIDAAMRALIAARTWLTVFHFPSYAPDLNPAEGVWAHLKRSLGNLAPCSIDELAALARTRLKRMQYQACLLDGFIVGAGLALTRRSRHPEPKRSLAAAVPWTHRSCAPSWRTATAIAGTRGHWPEGAVLGEHQTGIAGP